MVVVALLVIGLSGYWSFARRREGSHSVRSIAEGVLVAAMFLLFGGAMFWLVGGNASGLAEHTAGTIGLAFVTALIGAFGASLSPLREPMPHW